MIQRIKIGNSTEIKANETVRTRCIEIMSEVVSMTESEVQAYCDNHFSALPAKAKEGIDKLFKVVWAEGKILKKLANQ